ncbi:TPA: ABC transporter substrate-binding protein, partial [Enterococcus faecium]
MKMNEKIRNMTIGLFCAATVSILLTGCGSGEATKQSAAADDSLDTIIEKAKEEGEIASLGMPDTWANWVGTWNDLEKEYGLSHVDTDMSSAEELAKFESEG